MSVDNYLHIDNWKVFYTVIGKGHHVVLFMQGRSHCLREFGYQIDNFDREEFTIVAWDPPGCAKSRPPERDEVEEVHSENADFAFKLMRALDFNFFSVWGAGSGGMTSLILAARYPDAVRSLVLSNTRSLMLPNDHRMFGSKQFDNALLTTSWYLARLYIRLQATTTRVDVPISRNKGLKYLDSCSHQSLHARIEHHRRDLQAKLWAAWLLVLKNIVRKNNGSFFVEKLEDICCPTLILSGGEDPILSTYLHKHIDGSELYVDPKGRYSFHQLKPEQFNRRIQDFLIRN